MDKCVLLSRPHGQTGGKNGQGETGEPPHTSPHYGTELDCTLCHKQHAKNENYCNQCHKF